MMRLEVHPCVLPDGYTACVIDEGAHAVIGITREQWAECPLVAARKALTEALWVVGLVRDGAFEPAEARVMTGGTA